MTLENFSFSIKGKIGGDQKTNPVDEQRSKPLQERFQLKLLSIRLDRREPARRMAEMDALGGRREEKKRRSKVVLKYDNGEADGEDEDPEDGDLSDKENAPTAKTSKTKLTVKMPFFFGRKSKAAGKVKRTRMADFFEENSAEKKSENQNVEGNDETETTTTTTTTGEDRLDENGNIKAKRVKNDDSDSDSDSDSDDDDDDIVKRREKNLLDNQRMLRQMMAEFDDKSSFKPASMRRMSLPASESALGEGGERRSLQRRRQSMGIVALQANRKSPPRTRSHGVDGEHVDGLKDDDVSLRRRIDYNDNLKV